MRWKVRVFYLKPLNQGDLDIAINAEHGPGSFRLPQTIVRFKLIKPVTVTEWKKMDSDNMNRGQLSSDSRLARPGSPSYRKLCVNCDLSYVSLQEAARFLHPTPMYTLRVHPDYRPAAGNILKDLHADVKDNPFAPYVNLMADETFDRYEWALCAEDEYTTDLSHAFWVGSPGVFL